MKRTRLMTTTVGLIGAGLLLSACGGGVSDSDRGSAEDAALEAVGDGRVTEVEEADGDETAAFDVEVTLDSGESIDVELDADFAVLNQGEIDGELAEEQGGAAAGGETTGTPAPGADDGDRAPEDTVDDDTPLEGRVRQQAVAAARAEVGQGRVEDATYADPDERHVYEVEINVRQGNDDEDVTVELDERFAVVRVDR